MEMNSYSGKRIYQKNCRMNGCFDWAMYGRRACVGCGHDKAEHDRRTGCCGSMWRRKRRTMG